MVVTKKQKSRGGVHHKHKPGEARVYRSFVVKGGSDKVKGKEIAPVQFCRFYEGFMSSADLAFRKSTVNENGKPVSLYTHSEARPKFKDFNKPPAWMNPAEENHIPYRAAVVQPSIEITEDENGVRKIFPRLLFDYAQHNFATVEHTHIGIELLTYDGKHRLWKYAWNIHHNPNTPWVEFRKEDFNANPLKVGQILIWSDYGGCWAPI